MRGVPYTPCEKQLDHKGEFSNSGESPAVLTWSPMYIPEERYSWPLPAMLRQDTESEGEIIGERCAAHEEVHRLRGGKAEHAGYQPSRSKNDPASEANASLAMRQPSK